MTTLYTYGYTGATPADLTAYIDELDAYLIDIRYSPRSRVPQWRRDALQRLAGVTEHGRPRYRHIGAFGNVNYAGDGPIEISSPIVGLREIAPYRAARPVILLCGCRDWQTCHRRAVATLVDETFGGTSVHLPGRYGTTWRLGVSTIGRETFPTPGWRPEEAVVS